MKNSNSFPEGRPRFHTRHGRLLALLGAWLCLMPAAYAIDPDRAMSQYVHDQWGTEQGFPKAPVYAITQTDDGYLWIGTEAGLVRFDGWNFRVIKDDSGAFTIGSVLGLTADRQGCLWVRLQDLSTMRYCRGVFDRPGSSEDLYTRIEAMSRSTQGGVVMWKAEQGAFGFDGGPFEKLASAADLPPSPVISLAQTRNGDVWMGTRDAGLFRDSAGKMRSIRTGLPDLKVNCLLADGDQALWVGTDDGIVRWDGKHLATAGMPASLGRFQALAMLRDRDGNVWAGTDSRGPLRLNSHGVALLKRNAAAPTPAVTALFEDREGELWIGHADGIERLRDSAFVTYSTEEKLPADGSNPVFADALNRIWFPPATGGLWWFKGDRHASIDRDGLNQDIIYSIAGRGNDLWVGRQRGGLTRLHFDGDSVAATTFTEADGLAQNSVYSVDLSRDGTVWAGTLSAGVSRLRDGRIANFTMANGLASNTVASILEAADGAMWFATPSGLSALSRGHWATYGTRDGLPSENVNCLLEDSTGVLWAGTGSGIAFRGPAGFQVPAGVPASLRAQILGLAEDRYGWLWVATADRVLRVNRDKLARGGLGEGNCGSMGSPTVCAALKA